MMAVKKGDRMDLPIDAEDDPAVSAALGPNPGHSRGREDVYGRIERARRMTPGQRRKLEKDAARSKMTVEMPEELRETIEAMARDVYQCPPSHMVAFLVVAGLLEVSAGRLNVYDYRTPSRVPRYLNFLDFMRLWKSGKWKI